jgi:tetratricopeptide (TPR) repeat protein
MEAIELPESTMNLRNALFKFPYLAYRVDSGYMEKESFQDWELEPIMGPTLAPEYIRTGVLQGYFIISAKLVTSEGPMEDCYLDVSLPERISEHHLVLRGGTIAKGRGRRLSGGTIIPAIAIEKHAVYTLYLATENPQFGIDVLREGISHARDPVPIALDLAYVLRDAKLYKEAIDAFSVALGRLPVDRTTRFYYLERALLYEKTGELEKARIDRSLAGVAGNSP